MPEMSASAQQSLAVAVDTADTAATAEPTLAPAAVVAPPTPTPTQATAQVAPATIRPCWRTTTAGYLLLCIATAFAWFIPHLHLHAKIGEEALVLLDIAALLIATGLIVGGYFRSIIRKL